jgi:2-phospho-L-lactate guanylyltransferase (CobY/MobA/RfbA family)
MYRFKLMAGFAAIAVAVTPAAASAYAKPSMRTVRTDLRSADQALTMVADLVKNHDGAAAAIQIVRNRRQTQAAAHEAARVSGARGRAAALQLVARQYSSNTDEYAGLVDQVTGCVQTEMASAISASENGRENALNALTGLMSTLPADAQSGIARAIAALTSSEQSSVASIGTALHAGVSPAAQPALNTALTQAVNAMDTGLKRLQGIVAQLPTAAQGSVQSAINGVSGILQGILGGGTSTLGGILAGLPVPGGLPIGVGR